MLLLTQERVNEFLGRIGWGTIFFLVGIFGLVAALDITNIIAAMGEGISAIVGDNKAGGVVFLTWVPAALSAVIDNIPVSIVLAPVALNFPGDIFAFVLITAVNIGGYILPIGAPANLMAMGLAEAQHDPISFVSFAKVATGLAVLHLLISTGWLFLLSLVI
jgi:Na+/H+ antiporter NhaD/arsenite permease-like protein